MTLIADLDHDKSIVSRATSNLSTTLYFIFFVAVSAQSAWWCLLFLWASFSQQKTVYEENKMPPSCCLGGLCYLLAGNQFRNKRWSRLAIKHTSYSLTIEQSCTSIINFHLSRVLLCQSPWLLIFTKLFNVIFFNGYHTTKRVLFPQN